MVLIPPLHHPNFTLQPLWPIAQLIYCKCINVILNGIPVPPDALLHGPNYHRIQLILHGGPLLPLRPDSPCYLTHNTTSYEVAEPLQNLHNGICDDPYLPPVNKDHLYHSLVDNCPGPHRPPCLHQNPQNHAPTPLRLLQILVEGRPVTIIVQYGADQIREYGKWLQGVNIDLSGHLDCSKTLL